MCENLYLKNLSVSSNSGTKCYVLIPQIKAEYDKFKIVPCDGDGKYLNQAVKPRIVEKAHIQDRKIYFERSKDQDKYYKIIPVLNNGCEIQADENNKDNVITVKMMTVVVKYSYNPPAARKFSIFNRRGTNSANLDLTCIDSIGCGEIGYMKGDIFLPLPKINKNESFSLPIDDKSINLVKANNNSKFIIEKV